MACCRGLSSCSRVLSFVSCLQMQQKVKVTTTCFDLLIFLSCFGLYTSCPPLPSPPLSSPFLSFLVATLHPAPPSPSLVLTDLAETTTIFSFPRAFRGAGAGVEVLFRTHTHWRSSLRSNQRPARRQKTVWRMPARQLRRDQEAQGVPPGPGPSAGNSFHWLCHPSHPTPAAKRHPHFPWAHLVPALSPASTRAGRHPFSVRSLNAARDGGVTYAGACSVGWLEPCVARVSHRPRALMRLPVPGLSS